jgi:hypothetical protein
MDTRICLGVIICYVVIIPHSWAGSTFQNHDSADTTRVKIRIGMCVEASATRLMGTIRFVPQYAIQPARIGTSGRVQLAIDLNRSDSKSSWSEIDLGAGYAFGNGRAYHKSYIDETGSEKSVITGYEAIHSFMLYSAIGLNFGARNSTYGLFAVLENHFVLNRASLPLSPSLKPVIPYLGLEIRWVPEELAFISSSSIRLQRTVNALTTVSILVQNYILSFGVNFSLYAK